MERIRKGNDINISWEIYASDGVNEYPYVLIGKNIEVIIKNAFTEIPVNNYTINSNVIRFTFGGKSQDHVGLHSITLIENNGLPGMHTVDECNAFVLVGHSCQVGGDQEEEVKCVDLKFKGNIDVCAPDNGGGENGGDFEVRTVYPTKQTVLEEETFDITEEERAYNIETLSKTLSGKTVFCKVGEAILFPTILMSGAVTEATYSTVVVFEGSLSSYSLTITSNGDAEVFIADVTTGGGGEGSIDPTLLEGYMPMMREFSDDFNDDFAR